MISVWRMCLEMDIIIYELCKGELKNAERVGIDFVRVSGKESA